MKRFKDLTNKRQNLDHVSQIKCYISGWQPRVTKKDGTQSKQKLLEVTFTGNKPPTRKEHRGQLTDGSAAFAIPVFEKRPLDKPDGNKKYEYVPYYEEPPLQDIKSIHDTDEEIRERDTYDHRYCSPEPTSDAETESCEDHLSGEFEERPCSTKRTGFGMAEPKEPSTTKTPNIAKKETSKPNRPVEQSKPTNLVSPMSCVEKKGTSTTKTPTVKKEPASNSSNPEPYKITIPLNNHSVRLYIFEKAVERYTVANNNKDYDFVERDYLVLRGVRYIVSPSNDGKHHFSLEVDDIEAGKISKPKEDSIMKLPIQIRTPLSDSYSIEVLQALLKVTEMKHKNCQVVSQEIDENNIMFVVPPENFCYEPPELKVEGGSGKEIHRYARQSSITNLGMYKGADGESEPYARACLIRSGTFKKLQGTAQVDQAYMTISIEHFEDTRELNYGVPFVQHTVEATLFSTQASGIFRITNFTKTSELLSFSRPGFVIEGKVARKNETTERKNPKRKTYDPLLDEEAVELQIHEFGEHSIYRQWFGEETEIRGHQYTYVMNNNHIEWLTEKLLLSDALRVSREDLVDVVSLCFDLDLIAAAPKNITKESGLQIFSTSDRGVFTKMPTRTKVGHNPDNPLFAWYPIEDCGYIPKKLNSQGAVLLGFVAKYPQKDAGKIIRTPFMGSLTIGDIIADNRAFLNTKFCSKSYDEVRFQNVYLIVRILLKKILFHLMQVGLETIATHYSTWMGLFTTRLMKSCNRQQSPDAVDSLYTDQLSSALSNLTLSPFCITVPPPETDDTQKDEEEFAKLVDIHDSDQIVSVDRIEIEPSQRPPQETQFRNTQKTSPKKKTKME